MAQPASPPRWSTIVKNPAPTPTQSASATWQSRHVARRKGSKGVSVAVVDANAVINGGDGLAGAAESFVTVKDVYDEVRDPVSRHRLGIVPFGIECRDPSPLSLHKVWDEIPDPELRHRLGIVPFSIECRNPSPLSLHKVISFARATGDLQTLSDVDLKLIALTYTLEAQIHGTSHLRETPPPIHTVNVKRLPEKDLPGWGSNVPNLEEWEALEDESEQISNSNTRILPLQDLNLNTIPSNDFSVTEEGSTKIEGESPVSNQEDTEGSFRKPNKFLPKKKEVNIEGKIVADGVDASQGQFDDNDGDFQPAVSRSTRRRYYKRQARRQSEALSETDSQLDVSEERESDNLQHSEITEEKKETEVEGNEDLSEILDQMRLEEETLGDIEEGDEKDNPCEEAMEDNDGSVDLEGEENENISGGLESLEMPSDTNESLDVSCVDDKSSEQSWRLRSLSESSVVCVTSDFAMQNVLLQMGLRLLAPGGMQIRELHRWILKCHACFKVTTEIGKIFCPSCGNGGTLRKVAVTVGENGIVVSARRTRVSVRGTRFSLPRPQGGREAITKNPVLREDQLPHKFLHPKIKKKNMEGDDLFSSDDLFHHHATDKKAPLRPPVRKALAVFSGKRNPNDNHYSRARH